MALLYAEADECPGCRQPRSESMQPDAEGQYTAKARYCFACQAVAGFSKDFSDSHAHGAYFRAERRT